MRIGHGYDAHRFTAGGRLMLGGVEVPFDKSLAAHSDGDVIIHAICDALLGAAALGDIGKHFPDSDPELKGVDSRILLRGVTAKLRELHLSIANVDATVIAQRPRLSPHFERMRECLAADMGIDIGQINLKGTTTEGMGFAGREEGIEAHAVVLLESA